MVRGTLLKASVLGWSIVLALVFIVCTAAITALGTKSSGQFTTFQPPPDTTQPKPPARAEEAESPR
jgi:hypothetical protein